VRNAQPRHVLSSPPVRCLACPRRRQVNDCYPICPSYIPPDTNRQQAYLLLACHFIQQTSQIRLCECQSLLACRLISFERSGSHVWGVCLGRGVGFTGDGLSMRGTHTMADIWMSCDFMGLYGVFIQVRSTLIAASSCCGRGRLDRGMAEESDMWPIT
jgi:hypothetical protein